MPAPTVTRPTAATTSVADSAAPGEASFANQDWAKYAVWGLMALVALSVVGLASAYIITKTESSRTAKLQGEWDEYYNAVKDQKTDEERIEALEKLADNPKIKGTAVHAYALSSLARMNFEIALNVRKQPETRGAAIDRAAKLYEMLAVNEPFKSNPAFGPAAVQDLAAAYEHQQMSDPASTKFYDEAIKALRTAMYKDDSKEPEPVKFFQTHYLFDKMNAQLGRIYWLRSLRKIELEKNPDAGRADREAALYFVRKALDAGVTTVEKDRYDSSFKGAWREEAAYIKSLLDANGKMMADGKAPPVKVEPPKTDEKKPEAGANAAPRATEEAAKPAVTAKPVEAKKADEAKKPDDAKKVDPKKDEPKKTGSNTTKSESVETASEDTGAPAKHMSYSQIQAMLKSGRTSMCQCPRCAPAEKVISAKLVE